MNAINNKFCVESLTFGTPCMDVLSPNVSRICRTAIVRNDPNEITFYVNLKKMFINVFCSVQIISLKDFVICFNVRLTRYASALELILKLKKMHIYHFNNLIVIKTLSVALTHSECNKNNGNDTKRDEYAWHNKLLTNRFICLFVNVSEMTDMYEDF